MARIFELIQASISKNDKEVCFANRKKGEWQTYSSAEYRNLALRMSYGLKALGLGKLDRVASITNNRPEWNFLDLGLQQAGYVHVPVYPTISDKELVFIINDCQARILFVSNKYLFNKVQNLLPQLPTIGRIFTFDNVEGAENFEEVLRLGDLNSDPEWLRQCQDNIDPDEYYTILYTSGTTGDPKGVMLTHASHLAIILDLAERVNPGPDFKAVSYLPLNHIFERTVGYVYQIRGVSIYYADSVASIIENFREVKPGVLSTVPLLMEKVYTTILAKGDEMKGFKKKVFRWALKLSYRFDFHRKNRPFYLVRHKIADRLVYRHWRAIFGGNLSRVMCGGAAMQKELFHLFWAAGIPILQGYGLTETSGLIAIDRLGERIKLNKCGKKMKHLEVKIAEDGEILARGTAIMKGYFNNPELTAREVEPDGWFHSGDIGTLDEDGYLQVIGRKKAFFKTSNGLYVNPEEIENTLKHSPFIGHVMVVGANQLSLSALIVPDFNYLSGWCERNNLSFPGREEMIADPFIREQVGLAVSEYNAHHWEEGERIRNFRILKEDWTIESGDLTPSMKIKRGFLHEKYKETIVDLFRQ